MHYYSHNIGDYRKDTVHLSLLEHGVYRQLLDTYYLSEKPLTLDHADLMRTHCARNADEVRAIENVLKDFFFWTEKGYIHKRCDVEIEAFHSKSVSARESAKARWDRVKAERDANALRTQCEGNANHKPLTNNQEPIKAKQDQDQKTSSAPRRDWLAELIELGVAEKHAKDWLEVRKAKKAKMTDTALDGLKREAAKAGLTVGQAIQICAERSWQGFNASWLDKPGQQAGGFLTKQERIEAANQQVLAEMNAAADAMLAGKPGSNQPVLDDQGYIIEGDFFHAT